MYDYFTSSIFELINLSLPTKLLRKLLNKKIQRKEENVFLNVFFLTFPEIQQKLYD
jgi:hypothetical protein